MRGLPQPSPASPMPSSPRWKMSSRFCAGEANRQRCAWVQSGPDRRPSNRRSASSIGTTASSGEASYRRATSATECATSTGAPSPRRSPSSATSESTGWSLTNAAVIGGHSRRAQPAATAITGCHSRPSSRAAAGESSGSRRRAWGSGIARTTASAVSPSTVGPGSTRSTGCRSATGSPRRGRRPGCAARRTRPADGPGRGCAPTPEDGQLRRPRPDRPTDRHRATTARTRGRGRK